MQRGPRLIMLVMYEIKREQIRRNLFNYEDDVASSKDVVSQVHVAVCRCTSSTRKEVGYIFMKYSDGRKHHKILKKEENKKTNFGYKDSL